MFPPSPCPAPLPGFPATRSLRRRAPGTGRGAWARQGPPGTSAVEPTSHCQGMDRRWRRRRRSSPEPR
eukprot:9385816-Alexandrium_andersonii.AAC.1